jgi:hypothetical protein
MLAGLREMIFQQGADGIRHFLAAQRTLGLDASV